MTSRRFDQMERIERRTWLRRLARLAADRCGATAVEVALLAPVFLYLLVGIIEVSMLLYTTTVMDGAVQDASRQIRTGQAELSGDSLTTFQNQLCSSLGAIYDCNNVTLYVSTSTDFSSVDLTVELDDDGEPVNTGYTTGSSGEITIVRVHYRWNFTTPYIGTFFGDTGSGVLYTSTGVFRNEPYSS